MSLSWKLVLWIAMLKLVQCDFPIDFDEPISRNVGDEAYRLPESLDPVHFEVEITPYFEDTDFNVAFTFDGKVTINVTAKEAVDKLIIHENVRQILSVTVLDSAGTPLALNMSYPFERIQQHNFLQINLQDRVVVDQYYFIKIDYVGNINETPLSRGVFRGSYSGSDGKVHWYAACHLQPVNSRQAFPCFDEPGYKSTFDMIINRPANFTETFGNMKIKSSTPFGDRVKEVFHTTPRMSAYLISFHISEEFTVIAENNDPAKSYRIIARPEAVGQGDYALEVGPPITKWLDEYFGIEYYEMADDIKNDQIAVPDWASGATENWGLVSYRENILLYEEGETHAEDKQTIGTITAHELAHKWFGNLITTKWWDNVWINEGFASYFEYFAMDGVDPQLDLASQFNIMYLQNALSSDSSASTRALEHEVNTPTQVTGHFSGISYTKGASFLHMLKHFLTENTFKKALNYFLTDKSYKYAEPSDLYQAFANAVTKDGVLSDLDVNITEFMKYWVEEPGYPVLTVTVDTSGDLLLKQERFFISSSAAETEQVWQLPLTYTTGSNPDWNNVRARFVLKEKTDRIPNETEDEWIIFNVQQTGYYRVNYDEENWRKLALALRENYSSIHYLNRAQIVDDVFAFMQSERLSYNLGFQILDFLKQDTSFYSWYPAISGFSWYRNRFLHLPNTLAEFDEILFSFLDGVINEIGYEYIAGEPHTTTLTRFYIMTLACNAGHPGCVSNAVEQFTAFRNGSSSVNPNVRRHVFCTGIRMGTYEDWHAIYQRQLSSNNRADDYLMLRTLGCTSNEQAVNEYLQMILSDYTKAQDRLNGFTFLLMGQRENSKIVLEFLKENVDEIRTAVVLPAWFNSLLSNVASYLDEEGLDDMESWLRSNQNSIPEAAVGLNAIASVRANMKWGSDNAHLVLPALRGNSILTVPSVMVLLVALFSFVLN